MTKQRTSWSAFFLNCSCSLLLLIGQFEELIGWKRTVVAGAFEVLPFVHIDYGHYLRLAECQAKCSQKYGLLTERILLDGSARPYCNTSAEMHEICEMGCSIHLKSPTFSSNNKPDEEGFVLEAFQDGQSFWRSSSSAANSRHHQKQAQPSRTSSPIEKIRVLCLERSSTSNIAGALKLGSGKRRSIGAANRAVSAALFDTFEAILTADLRDEVKLNRSFAQYKYIVQWRQKQTDSEDSKEEETRWITASIEPSNTFRVTGLQPGFVYRFMLTIVTPAGKMVGENGKSDWINFAKLAEGTNKVGAEKAALSFHSEYNLEHNVGAVVRWVHFTDIFKTILPPNHPQLLPTSSSAQLAEEAGHAQLFFEGCRMQIEYANKTTKIVEDFAVDESDGFLLKNLGFHSEYSVEIRPRQSLLAEQQTFYHNQVLSGGDNSKSGHLTGKFLSMSCSQVYGPGSLECEPEPVQNIEVQNHPENGTVTVWWTPPAEMHHILLYQLYYLPASESVDCALEPTSLFLTANSTSASLQMPTLSECEFEIRLVNYDLLGREATASKHFVFSPAPDGIAAIDLSRRTTCLIIGLFVVMGLALFVVIKFAAFWPARLKKVAMASTSNAPSISSTASNASINSSACSSKRPSSLAEEV